jgi:lambda family phage tail tape measure protein
MATIENFILRVKTEGAENIKKLSDNVSVATDKFNALSAAIPLAAMGAFAISAIRMAESLQDLSDATGISVAKIAAFGSALQEAGGKSSNAERIITSFFNTIEAAADGSLKLQEAFKKVGVSLDDLRNLSEADLLDKTIKGLANMEAGSQRTALATTLLSRAFRSVDPKVFDEALRTGDYTKIVAAAKASADAIGQMEKAYKELQLAAAEALTPILKEMAKFKLSGDDAALALKVVGITLGLAFGASILKSITTINAALGITAGLSNLIGKGPLGLIVKLAAVGGTAAATGLAIEQLSKKNDELAASAAEAADAMAYPTITAPSGSVGRTVIAAESPEEKARKESVKRIAAFELEARKITALSIANEAERIEIESASAIEIARSEIFGRENLNRAQMEREFAAAVGKINADLAAKQKKLSEEVFLKRLADAEAVREETGRELAQIEDQIAKSTAQGQEQARLYREASEQARERSRFEESLLMMREEDRRLAQEIFAIEQKRRQELDRINQLQMDPMARQRAIADIIAVAETDIAYAKMRRETFVENQNDFAKGWADAFQKYQNSAKTAAQQAQSYFDTFTRGFEDAIVRFVQTGKLSFKDLANSIIAEFARAQANRMAGSILGFVGKFFGGGGFGTGYGYGNLDIGGFLASGGPVRAGNNYIVGEEGPELFVPKSSGTIVPNDMLGGGSQTVNVNYNIQAVDAQSFRSLVARDPQFIYQVTEAGRRSQPTRRLA